jgi:hypothetical protein
MHSIHIAEYILGLVTSRDRAASTVGDLVEGAATRGAAWFWSGILRTAASLLWRGVAENPVRVTGVAFTGLAVDVATSLLLAGLSGVAFFVAARSGHPAQLSSIWWIIGLDAPALLMLLLIGRMLARWAPGRELSACLAYAILGSIFSLIADLIHPGGLGFSALLWVFLGDAAQRTLVLAGAVWGRHRRLVVR